MLNKQDFSSFPCLYVHKLKTTNKKAKQKKVNTFFRFLQSDIKLTWLHSNYKISPLSL